MAAVDREAAALSVVTTLQRLKSALSSLPSIHQAAFLLENLLITCQRFQLPAASKQRDTLVALEELLTEVARAAPECQEYSAHLLRISHAALKPQQLREMDELRKVAGLADRVPHVAQWGAELQEFAALLTTLRDISLSPDDLVDSVLERLADLPLPPRLKMVVSVVQQEAPGTPWTASDLRDAHLLEKRQRDLARHATALDQTVAVLVHQRSQIAVDDRDLAESIEMVDTLLLLLRTLQGLCPVAGRLLERVRALEEVAHGCVDAAAQLLVLMQPAVRGAGFSIESGSGGLLGGLWGGGSKWRSRVSDGEGGLDCIARSVVGLYFATAALGATGLVLLIVAVVSRKRLSISRGALLYAVICLAAATFCCLVACFVSSNRIRSLEEAAFLDQQRQWLLGRQQQDPYAMQGPGMGGGAWREPRRGAVPQEMLGRNVAREHDAPYSRAVNASMYQFAGGAAELAVPPGMRPESVSGAVAEEIREYAVFLGIDPDRDPDLLFIAEQAYFSPLPPPWQEHAEPSSGNVFYYNPQTRQSAWAHPLEEQFRAMAARALADKYAARPPLKPALKGARVAPEPPVVTLRDPGAEAPPEVLELAEEGHAGPRGSAGGQQQQQQSNSAAGSRPVSSGQKRPRTPGEPFVRQHSAQGSRNDYGPGPPPKSPPLPYSYQQQQQYQYQQQQDPYAEMDYR
jgi:hypothetical protein